MTKTDVNAPISSAEVLQRLREIADPKIVENRAGRFGISTTNALGVSQQDLKLLAREIGQNDALAVALFNTGVYEARLLCSKLFDPAALTEAQMDAWAMTFDNWEICDSFCMGFFARSAHARAKAEQWSTRQEEFVKRAAFSIMASYGFAHKQAPNEVFERFLVLIERESTDERHYVSKAVNWALRNIGKRNRDLQGMAISLANKLKLSDAACSRWIGSDALRELDVPGRKLLDYPRQIYRR